jgi:hypothetical protein
MRTVAVVLFVALASLVVPAEASDDATNPPGETTASTPGSASYFLGTWTGSWPMGSGADVEIVIGKRLPDGTYKAKYTWGEYTQAGMEHLGGSKRVIGKERGDALVLEWEAKDGNKREILLTRYKEDVVKARLERLGTIGGKGMRQNFETYLRRK